VLNTGRLARWQPRTHQCEGHLGGNGQRSHYGIPGLLPPTKHLWLNSNERPMLRQVSGQTRNIHQVSETDFMHAALAEG
jgi:hypothetical protein